MPGFMGWNLRNSLRAGVQPWLAWYCMTAGAKKLSTLFEYQHLGVFLEPTRFGHRPIVCLNKTLAVPERVFLSRLTLEW